MVDGVQGGVNKKKRALCPFFLFFMHCGDLLIH